MLELGATTFWEHFDVKWLENGSRIDQPVEKGKTDVHAELGEHCFKWHRHSLCHGWAGGVTAWLSKHVLGIKILEAGFKKISVEPFLGDLEYVEGTYPTTQGQISVRHIKETSNKITTKVDVPAGIEVQLL